jgi:protein involved in polysaccharide export with SLBB domain
MPLPVCAFCLLVVAVAGCAVDQISIEKRLASGTLPHDDVHLAESYVVSFPDVLELQVTDRPDLTGRCAIGLDGRIDLGNYPRPRVEGRTLADIGRLVAGQVGVLPAHVHLRVAEYRSQQLFLSGQVTGWQRTVPYQGQETILDVLQRVGGITPGAAPEDVYLVRSHIADGQKPEVFHVDLNAIVMKDDQRTNIRVLPYDQIYVGQSRQAKLLKCVPPWLKPVLLPLLGPRQSRPDARSLEFRPTPLEAARSEKAEPTFAGSP